MTYTEAPTIDHAVETAGPTLGQLYARWTLVFTAVFTVGIWIPMFLFLDDGATGIGVGVFTAFWGAPGFGLMAAGAQWWKRTEVGHIGAHTRTNALAGLAATEPKTAAETAERTAPQREEVAAPPARELAFA